MEAPRPHDSPSPNLRVRDPPTPRIDVYGQLSKGGKRVQAGMHKILISGALNRHYITTMGDSLDQWVTGIITTPCLDKRKPVRAT